jgi:hypothetical protein
MSLSDDDLDLLADLLAGEGTDAQVARVAASPDLAQALADLEAAQRHVAQDLTALAAEDVQPPAGFAERLTAALAAEAGPPERARPQVGGGTADRSDAVDASGPSDAARDVVPLDAARTRRAHARPTPAPWIVRSAAGFVALAAAVGIGLAATQGGGGSDGSDDLAAASAAGEVPTTTSGRDYRDTTGVSAALPTLLGRQGAARGESAQSTDAVLGGTATGGTATGGGEPLGEGAVSTGGSTTGTTGAQAPALPSPNTADSSAPTPTALDLASADPAALDRLRDPAGLRACYLALELAPDTSPLALDYASWRGEPALLILLPVAAQPQQVEAYVVGADCGAGTDALRFFGRLDRP